MAAKRRGAIYICDRGSSHIRYQNSIVQAEYDLHGLKFSGIDPRVVELEEAEYELADTITVPSSFALRTFVEQGTPQNKLHLVPYGVELESFRPISSPPDGEFRVLFAGSISLRKGIPYLLAAYDRLCHPRKSLTLAGVVDRTIEPLLKPFRMRDDIRFTGSLPRHELVRYMSESHTMVLPSIEEGLALVQAQALACGCPVIATTNTGAEDLFTDGREGYIVPIRDADSITARLQRFADDPHQRQRCAKSALDRVKGMGGWNHYGELMSVVFRAALDFRQSAA
jgi:glycosyltransferase involved in cell wall biosynthesis